MPVPHQPPNNIPLASSLPKVSFRKIPTQEANQLLVPAGVQDLQHINFGFNNGSEFEKPEHYLRYVEPIESELNKQVEYDMDEQDQEWLDALNIERRRDQLDIISYEVFEIIIDRLEKEWFDLMKRVPVKPIPIAIGEDGEPIGDGNEDIECAICDDGECENSNAIVFCDGCNLAVHQDCYGIPYIPEGQWLCRKCTVSPDRAVSCVLCPHEGGAFKQTTQGKWAHLLCAMWIPETGVSNPVYMEPIDSIERIPKARWKLQCYLCKYKNGACIQCDNKNCFTAFHVTCARRANLLLKSQRQRMTHSHDEDSDDEESSEVLRAWCHKHIPKSLRAQRARQREEEEGDLFEDASSQPRSASPVREGHRKHSATIVASTAPGRKKSARAYKKSYRAGPSLVPAYVLNRVLEHISRIHIRKKPQLAMQIAKFWSLKREARRGAPLLKRLHLEPWTASTNNKEQTDAERIKKLQFQLRLREDLEKVRMLAELVRKREKEKLRQVQLIRKTLVDGILFPYHDTLRKVLERISAIDRTSLFLNPVSLQKVPDYNDVIKQPMDWNSIAAKLDDFQYTSVAHFIGDITLVLDNAMLYNKIDTHYHRTAARIKKVAEPIFEDLHRIMSVHGSKDSDLHLEAEEDIIDLLRDYTEEERLPSMDDCQNAIEEVTKQFYVPDPPRKSVEDAENQNGNVRISGQSRKAAERAARSERSRLAFQKRKEEKEARAKQNEEQEGDVVLKRDELNDGPLLRSDDEEEEVSPPRRRKGTGRYSKRQSAIKASRASLDARRRRAEKGEDAKEEEEEEEEEEDEEEDSQGGMIASSSNLELGQINSKDSFTLFNTGWVLPDGSKRRRITISTEPNVSTRITSEKSREKSSDLSELEDEEENSTRSNNGHRKRMQQSSEQENRKRQKRDSNTTPRDLARGQGGRFTSTTETITRSGGMEKKREGKDLKRKGKVEGGMEPSTLCWAKVEGYPPYAAEVFDEMSELVPVNVKRDKHRVEKTQGDQLSLVRFFDFPRSFAWIPTNTLELLFEDKELDERMLNKAKKTSHGKKVRKGYEMAMAEADV